MVVKPGYKRTEAGVIPGDWDVLSLEGIADPRWPICYGIVQVGPFTENGIPVIAIKNLNTDYFRNIHKSSHKIEKPYARSRVHPCDVLISVKGTTGRIGIVPQNFHGNISRDIARFHLSNDDVPEFWFQMLQSETAQKKLDIAKVGTTRMELSIGILKQVRIPRPPKRDQQAIATALSNVDSLIDKLYCLISKKRHLKQAAMRQLLTGKKRLPGFTGAWAQKRLGDACRITTGKKDVNEGNPSGQYPFFTCARENTYSDSFSFDGEAILIAGNGEVGNLSYFKGKFEAYQRTYVIQYFTCNVSYLWYQLSAHLVGSLGIGTIGSSIPYIKMENLLGFVFQSPHDEKEQTAIAAVLSDMDAEINELEARLSKTRLIKQGMMQELLTGKTRLIGA